MNLRTIAAAFAIALAFSGSALAQSNYQSRLDQMVADLAEHPVKAGQIWLAKEVCNIALSESTIDALDKLAAEHPAEFEAAKNQARDIYLGWGTLRGPPPKVFCPMLDAQVPAVMRPGGDAELIALKRGDPEWNVGPPTGPENFWRQIEAEQIAQRSTAQRDAPTVRFYNPNGSSAGSATTYGDTTKFYAPDGKLTGTVTNNGGRR